MPMNWNITKGVSVPSGSGGTTCNGPVFIAEDGSQVNNPIFIDENGNIISTNIIALPV